LDANGTRFELPVIQFAHQSRLSDLIVLFVAASAFAQIFREVPSTESGITWSHENGTLKKRYLPETTGAVSPSSITTTMAGWTFCW